MQKALYSRIEKNGWPLERALKIKIKPNNKLKDLIQIVLSGKFGTKNRAELIYRLQEMQK